VSQNTVPPPTNQTGGVAQAATIIALGNISSRVLGLLREQIIAYLFGASGLVSAFGISAKVPKMIYELLVGGMLSAALVPVFSQVTEQKGRPALWALFSRVLSLVAVMLAGIVLLLEIFASQLAWLLGGGFEPELQAALAQMLRVITPAVLFFGLSGVVSGLLYTLKRFTFPAFGATVFNLGIIIAAPLLAGRLDAYSLAVGVLLDLSDPALRRILVLYMPIALGLLVSNVQVAIDQRLASSTGESSIAWMDRATTLVQLPHGMVAVAISMAVLPTLSRLSAAGDREGFRQTLGLGLRLVLALIVPAALGLLVLAEPIVSLLFEHGKFTADDTYWTSWALRCYLLGLIFAAIDWPLNYAFYARQDTLTPALVGILSVVVYLVVALALIGPLGMLGLVLADSAKHFAHAVTMLVLSQRRMGRLTDLRLGQTSAKALLAGGLMTGLAALTMVGLGRLVTVEGLIGGLLAVVIPGTVGVLSYLAFASLLGIDEMAYLRGLLRERLRRKA
jgi:putative peptidoglycan lipid II flippase